MRRRRTYRRRTEKLVEILGLEIARARRERRWTQVELAERAMSSPATIRRIEQGDPTVAIGTVVEVATLAGIDLLAEGERVDEQLERSRDRLRLFPSRVRTSERPVQDDF